MTQAKQITATTLQEWGEDIFPKLSWFKRHKVEEAHVMVVGCGALGNEVLKNLALFGVGNLVIVDIDEVEYSNLTRSILFSQSDAEEKRPKVIAAAQKILTVNPSIDVLPIQGDISNQIGLGLLRQMDVVVGCLDNRLARYCLNRLCMRAGVPWVDGGINELEGVAKVFIPEKNCYACTLSPEALQDLSKRISCASQIKRNEKAERVATTPVIASIIGAIQAQEVMKLIHKEELEAGELTSLCGKMFYYEGQHLTSHIVEHQAWDADCPVHERWEPILKSTLSIQNTVQETLTVIAELLQVNEVEIGLYNHRFVDFIEEKSSGQQIQTLLPDYQIAAFIERNPALSYYPFSAFYQHEYRSIDTHFPYPDLTLQQIGIPPWDILPIHTEKGIYYVELLPDGINLSNCLSQNEAE